MLSFFRKKNSESDVLTKSVRSVVVEANVSLHKFNFIAKNVLCLHFSFLNF